jgi:RNA polymerase-binding transcription factor DksA
MSKVIKKAPSVFRELSADEFAKLPDTKYRYIICAKCDTHIDVPKKVVSPTIRCSKCKTIWKLRTDFALGIGEYNGYQLPYSR